MELPAKGIQKDFHLNGLLQFSTDVTFSGAGKKTFRNGIKRNCNNHPVGCGKFYLNGLNRYFRWRVIKNWFWLSQLILAAKLTIPSGALGDGFRIKHEQLAGHFNS